METVSDNTITPLGSPIPDTITASGLWFILLLALGVFSLLSAALLYHWREYALKKSVADKVIRIYFTVSGIFILLLVISVLFITF